MEITGRSSKRSLYRHFALVTENKNWVDAQVYCEEKYRASLVVIDNDSDKVLLEYYLKPLLGQLTCRLIFVSIDIIWCRGSTCDSPCITTDQGREVKRQGHKVTQRISSKNAITRQWTAKSASNLMNIFIVRRREKRDKLYVRR